jgi:hypothetical protein
MHESYHDEDISVVAENVYRGENLQSATALSSRLGVYRYKADREGRSYLLNLMCKSERSALKKERNYVSEIVMWLTNRHPNIMPPLSMKFIPDREVHVVIYPYLKGCSLYDMIHPPVEATNSRLCASSGRPEVPLEPCCKPLPDHNVREYGKQILQGLLYLRSFGITFSHLHVGNVFVIDGVAKIAYIENELLSLPIKDSVSEVTASLEYSHLYSVDCLQFGVLLYECATGQSIREHLSVSTLQLSILVSLVILRLTVSMFNSLLPL